MSAISIASVAVATRTHGYSFDHRTGRNDLQFQGDVGYGIARKAGTFIRVHTGDGHWVTRPRKAGDTD